MEKVKKQAIKTDPKNNNIANGISGSTKLTNPKTTNQKIKITISIGRKLRLSFIFDLVWTG